VAVVIVVVTEEEAFQIGETFDIADSEHVKDLVGTLDEYCDVIPFNVNIAPVALFNYLQQRPAILELIEAAHAAHKLLDVAYEEYPEDWPAVQDADDALENALRGIGEL
jgi:hypothetical protein